MNNATPARHGLGPGSISLLLALASLLAPQAARAQARIVTPVQTQTLDFGTFAVLPSCKNCTITISPTGLRTPSAGIVILSSKNVGRPARFSVTCSTGSCTYSPTVSGAPRISAGGVTLVMSAFTYAKSTNNTPSTLSVGARLTIPNSNAAKGTFTSSAFTLATANP